MRKQAAAEFVNSMMPWEIAKTVGTEAADAAGHFAEGNLGKGLWSGVKSLGNAAMMIPGVGALGWGAKLGFKGIGAIGKGLSAAGKGMQGAKTMPGLANAAGGASNIFGRGAQGFGQFGEKMVNPIDGMMHMSRFQGRMLGGGRAATAAAVLPFAGIAEMGGEAAWGARPNFMKPKLPEATGTSNQHFQMAKSYLGPQGGNPIYAGATNNPHFEPM